MNPVFLPNSASRKLTCVISPIGHFNDDLLQHISRHITETYAHCVSIESIVNRIDFAYDQNRNQYHSTPILDKLTKVLKPDISKVIALTSMDLFIPILTHVYGEAQLGGKSCIVSVARLKEGLENGNSQEAFHDRIIKEVLHELGHTFNLLHCKDKSCVMHYCRCIRDVDQKSNCLCRYCKVLLNDQLKLSQELNQNL
ncbi:archaemetzincin family Zn-dependent metalloprotease [bacterium]|nr:archaemetzincin family Zn-dependent metalloprotease [bacterium]